MTVPIPNHHIDKLITRRSILGCASAVLVCAPAIVRAENLMPVRTLRGPVGPQYAGFVERLFYHALESNLRNGCMTVVCNGRIVPMAQARRLVAHARAQGWLRKSGQDFTIPA
jgi:hypothetical protein